VDRQVELTSSAAKQISSRLSFAGAASQSVRHKAARPPRFTLRSKMTSSIRESHMPIGTNCTRKAVAKWQHPVFDKKWKKMTLPRPERRFNQSGRLLHEKRGLAYAIATLGFFLCASGPLEAEEGGSGDYAPGTYASLINITPNKPGWAVGTGYLFYSGSISGTLPFAGLSAADISGDVSLVDISLAYTFCPTILGAHYTASVAIPYAWVDAEAKVSLNPRVLPSLVGTRTKTVRFGANGISDMFIIPFALNWTSGDLQINPQLFMVAPTGSFVKGHLANVGKNHWYFDPVLGLSYLSHKTGTEMTVFAGVGFSTEDKATEYQNGDVFHLEATLQQYLPLMSQQNLLGIGVNGIYFQQITGDSGPGARLLGANEGTDIGLGPVVTFTIAHRSTISRSRPNGCAR
jgi:hypothetical protein